MLSIKHLTKTYRGGKTAVSDLSLEVESGDIYGFIGHNGAGKTTTIKAVVGINDFESGEICIDGISIKEDPMTCKTRIAYIPDNPDLYEYLTGIQYLNFIEITSALGDLISSYSHGMKQKLAIISALIHKPKLMILDEPFVGLDPKATLTLKNIMHDMCREGNAIFFSTHVLDVAEKLCNKVAIIKEGRLIASGNIKELTKGESLEATFMEVVSDVETNS